MIHSPLTRTGTGRADLHYHPLADESALYDPSAVLAHLAEIDLDVVAITEHDRVDLAADLIARARKIGLRTELISGCEVTTAAGHVLALFVDRAPTPGRSVLETVVEIHAAGGLAIAAHPLLPTCVSFGDLRASLGSPNPVERFDALEVANPVAAAAPLQGPLSERIARHYGVASVGGSDGHGGKPGGALTHFAGSSAAELRDAIVNAATSFSNQRCSRLSLALSAPRYLWRAIRRTTAARST